MSDQLNADEADLTWRDAALRVGEQLAENGPDGYYAFTQLEWLNWATGVIQKPAVSAVAVEGLDRENLLLQLRVYRNGANVNQALADDIERWRVEANAAMRQRDSLQGANNKLTAEVERLRAASRVEGPGDWQPIEQCSVTSKLGEERKRVLVYGPTLGVQVGYVIDYGDGTFHRAAEGFHGNWPITHWLALPQPPVSPQGAAQEPK